MTHVLHSTSPKPNTGFEWGPNLYFSKMDLLEHRFDVTDDKPIGFQTENVMTGLRKITFESYSK